MSHQVDAAHANEAAALPVEAAPTNGAKVSTSARAWRSESAGRALAVIRDADRKIAAAQQVIADEQRNKVWALGVLAAFGWQENEETNDG